MVTVQGHIEAILPFGQTYKLVTQDGISISFYMKDMRGTILASRQVLDKDGKPLF